MQVKNGDMEANYAICRPGPPSAPHAMNNQTHLTRKSQMFHDERQTETGGLKSLAERFSS